MAPPQTLPISQLGKDGPRVPRLGFGLMGLSIAYGPVPSEQDRLALLDHAWSLGATFWDTAQMYGDSEELVGKWFRLHPERRSDIFLATKFAIRSTVSAASPSSGPARISWTIDSSPEECRTACAESLQRLGTDYIDLYYVHRFDKTTPVEKTVEAMVELKEQGKIRHLGFSECSSSTLRRGYAVHPITAVQIEYHPWALEIESDAGTNLLATCRELGVAVVSYSPLGRGALTGRFKSLTDLDPTDLRTQLPRFHQDNFSQNLRLVQVIEEIAASKTLPASSSSQITSTQVTPAQLTLAWLLSQGPDIFPIPGTKSPHYLEQNLGALKVTITPDEDARIRAVIKELGGAAGYRTIGLTDSYSDTPPL
ncbi:NADP-dependent oxidoreductase domain-containing protein [Coniella lustricola]|uniref:NADP-dependent oxidoreductase domain-containing protein n=1 Tax=Coniella lustricola TaxID=2025994 RepID=A0A2T3A196_9PEZI|nr:NADP-dependent oxidoreductase domain-containing protein [Coniella lustricola]